MQLRLLDLFCGAGGMTQGFVQAGYDPVFAVDIDEWAIRSYQANFGTSHAVAAPIQQISAFPQAHIVIGGPPCQGFSLLGRNDPGNPLNSLWQHYLRALREADPYVFVMENVP